MLHNILVKFCFIPTRKEEFHVKDKKNQETVKSQLQNAKSTYKDPVSGKTVNISAWTSMKSTKSLFNDTKVKSIARTLLESIALVLIFLLMRKGEIRFEENFDTEYCLEWRHDAGAWIYRKVETGADVFVGR